MKVHELQNQIYTGKVTQGTPTPPVRKNGSSNFDSVLRGKLESGVQPVRLSTHAVERLAARNIALTENDMGKLSRAVATLDKKGGRDALMVMGDLAFVVSVKNKTVITVMDKSPSHDQRVFTNIDSAMII